jgi:hypothetical protein
VDVSEGVSVGVAVKDTSSEDVGVGVDVGVEFAISAVGLGVIVIVDEDVSVGRGVSVSVSSNALDCVGTGRGESGKVAVGGGVSVAGPASMTAVVGVNDGTSVDGGSSVLVGDALAVLVAPWVAGCKRVALGTMVMRGVGETRGVIVIVDEDVARVVAAGASGRVGVGGMVGVGLLREQAANASVTNKSQVNLFISNAAFGARAGL